MYIRVFLLGSAAACACKPHGLREHEDAAALLATVIRHGGEVNVCERCLDGQAGCADDLIDDANLASLAELSRCITEAHRLLVF